MQQKKTQENALTGLEAEITPGVWWKLKVKF